VYKDLPPDINYEELARSAGYSEEEIIEMFGEPVEVILTSEPKEEEEVEINELNLSTPLEEDIPF
jgi:hypothetical protein